MRHWTTMVVLVAAAAITAVCADNALTAMCLSLMGEAVYETNPFSNLLMGHWGTNLTMIANAFWSAVVIVWLCQQAVEKSSRFAFTLLLGLALIRGYAAVHNFGLLSGALS